jgi:protein-disulfide isomerase
MASNSEKKRLREERAAAALRAQQRRERRRQLLTVVGVLVAIAVVIGGGFLINSQRDTSKDVAKSIPDVGSSFGLTIGDDSAPHQIIVYEDFLCPICGEFEKAGSEQLTALADAGKVQIEYRPIVVLSRAGPYSARSAMIWGLVLTQDGPEVAKAYHDLLFQNQPSEDGPFPGKDELVTLAGQAGADVARLQAGIDSGAGIDFPVDATKKATSLGVKGTPTAFLDGELFTDYTTPDDLAANLVKAVS